MIKRTNVFLLVMILVLFIGGVFMVLIQKNLKVKEFELTDFQCYIDEFSSEENVGSIIDARDATIKAERIWLKMYGENIRRQRPYQVFYDEKAQIWLIRGNLKYKKGGVANILIESSNGKVLAVWHDK